MNGSVFKCHAEYNGSVFKCHAKYKQPDYSKTEQNGGHLIFNVVARDQYYLVCNGSDHLKIDPFEIALSNVRNLNVWYSSSHCTVEHFFGGHHRNRSKPRTGIQ